MLVVFCLVSVHTITRLKNLAMLWCELCRVRLKELFAIINQA